MIGWRFEEALALDTCEAVTRWWAQRGPSPAAPIPDGLVEDLQTARLALDEGLQGRLWDLAVLLTERQRRVCKKKIALLDPAHIRWAMAVAAARRDPVEGLQGGLGRVEPDLGLAIVLQAGEGVEEQ